MSPASPSTSAFHPSLEDCQPLPAIAAADRRRAMLGLFASAALAATGYIPALSVAPLAAEDMLGSPRWSGLPGAVTIAGMALGTSLLSAIMARRSRRFGLLLGFSVAALAVAVAGLGAGTASFPLFLAALFVFGAGCGARQLARYAAGNLYDTHYRGRAIGWVVWAGSVGSILGPLLLRPSQTLAERAGLPGLVGPYVLATVAVALAWVVLLVLFVDRRRAPEATLLIDAPVARSSLWQALASRRVRFALSAMVIGQFVMVLVMSMTPIHIRHAGGGLGAIGLVLSAHTLGMFGLSPLTGALNDRIGPIKVILLGGAMILGSTLLAAPAGGQHRLLLVIALFLLGLGWNFGFVAGSALLTDAVSPENRLRLQGVADTVVWSAAAAANLLSGVLLASSGYAALNAAGAGLVLLPPLLAWRYRRSLAASRAPASTR